jgi:hypothetical protein
MNDEVVFLLTKGNLPGTVVDILDSLLVLDTTVGGATDIVGPELERWREPGVLEDAGSRAWLFVESGQLRSESIHGGFRGRAGSQWILAVDDGTVIHGFVERGLRIGFPYNFGRAVTPVAGLPQRPRPTLEPHEWHVDDGVMVLAGFLREIQASISEIRLTYTGAGQAELMTGIQIEANGVKRGGWVFDLTGNFQMICGGDFHDSRSALRLLVYEGRSSPYVVPEPAADATPVPTPDGLFEVHVIAPGEYPEIDRFRQPQSAIDATATAFAAAPVVECQPH